jgi:hypothetical protein
MDAALWGFIGVVVGSIITGVVTIGGELLRGRNDYLLDSKKRQSDRRIESDRIQRETLLELQDRLTDWMESRPGWAGTSWKGTGEPTREMEEFVERSMVARRPLTRLTERLLDDELRETLHGLQDLSTEVVFAASASELQEAQRKALFAEMRAQGHVGRVLRAYLQPRDVG